MTWNTQLNEDFATVEARCSGNLSPNDLAMLAVEISFLVKAHGCAKILIDLSAVGENFPFEALPGLLDVYAEYRLSTGIQSGIVLGPAGASQDLSRLLAAAEDYGYRVDLLADRGQAEAWLLPAE